MKDAPFPLPKMIDDGEDRLKYDKKKLFLGLQKYWILILFFACVMALLALVFTHRLQQSYTADAVVLYDSGEQTFAQNIRSFQSKQLSLPTVLDMILLPANINAVKKALSLDLQPAEIRSMFYVPLPKGNSNFIHVKAKSSNPQLSIDLANTLARISVKASQDYARKQMEEALIAYEQDLQLIKETEAQQHALMEKFKSENAYFDMKPDETLFLAKLQDARDLRDKTALEYKGLQIQCETLKKKIEETPEYVPVAGRWSESPLHMRIASMEATLAEARAKYTKNNPKLLQLEEEADRLVRKSEEQLKKGVDAGGFKEKNSFREKLELELAQLQGRMKSAEQAKIDLDISVGILEEKLALLPSRQVALLRLLQATEITKERLKEANKIVDNVRQQVAIPSGNLALYEMATSATGFDDSFLLNLIPVFGWIFGAGCGILCALVLEMNDNKIRTLRECQIYYSIPCVESLPKLDFFLRSRAYDKFRFFIRNIAAHLDRDSQKRALADHKVIAFTSSIQGEGKSLLSSLTAEYYAILKRRVLLLEADPCKHSLLDPVEKTFSLKNFREVEASIQKGGYDRLVLDAQELRSKELLKIPQVADFWRALRANYDIVIIDAPAVLEENYTLDLCEEADLTLLIVGSSMVEKNVIDESLYTLTPCLKKVSGIVLNAIDKIYISGRRLSLGVKRARGGFFSYLYDICFSRG